MTKVFLDLIQYHKMIFVTNFPLSVHVLVTVKGRRSCDIVLVSVGLVTAAVGVVLAIVTNAAIWRSCAFLSSSYDPVCGLRLFRVIMRRNKSVYICIIIT